MSGFTIRNKGLRDAFAGMLADGKVTKEEVGKLIEQANKDGLISGREKIDLKAILKNTGDKFDADARKTLGDLVGVNTPVPGPVVTPETGITSDRVTTITDFKKVADTFSAEMTARASSFSTPEKAFGLFAEYAGKLKALGKNQDPRALDAEIEKLLTAGRRTPAAGYDKVDKDRDTLSDLKEVAMGRDAAKFEVRVMGADSPAWTTTYYPSAGSGGDMDQAGSPTSNLWAKEGPLGKLDKLLSSRGMADKAKALEFERKPMLGWLVGDTNTGHMAPDSTLNEANAEKSTGVDFDGDGKLTDGVKVDFLDGHQQFATPGSRGALFPKLGEERLTRKTVTDATGNKTFEFSKANGTKLTPDEAKQVYYTHASGDGKVDQSMSISWWGYCDQVALAGVLFKEPMKDSVVVDGVTFTKQDMLGLLTIIASSQTRGTGWAGNRYDSNPDLLTTKTGQRMSGKILNDDVQFRTADMRRTDGDVMVINKVDKDIKFRKMDGTEVTVKAADVASLAREDNMDMAPAEFHTTVIKWLGEDKRAAVMDRDKNDHVWNYNFWKATLKSGTELTGADLPKDPGHNGPANPANKIVKYEMEVLLGTSTDWGTNYSYWMEEDPAGKIVNSGWLNNTSPPDFLWRPATAPTWTGTNERNPFVDPKLVKEIYDKFQAG